jgi:multidrug efflux system membrane fusion protein
VPSRHAFPQAPVLRKGSAMARQPRIILHLLIILLFLLATGCGKKQPPQQQRPPAPVVAASATTSDIPVQLTAVGNVEPLQAVAIRPQVSGEIMKVHFTEGQEVAKGALLFTIDPRPAEAALKKAQAALIRTLASEKNARDDAARYERLFHDGIVTQEQFESYRTRAETFAADVAAERAAVDNARLSLAYSTIRSPISGRTGNLLVKAGNVVKANEGELVTVNQMAPISVAFTLPEKELARVRSRMVRGGLSLEAVPSGGSAPELGSVSFIDNTVDSTTGTIKMKGNFPNRSRALWPGQFTSVQITLETLKNAVVVPSQAVQTGQQRQFVFVVKADSTAELRPVDAGVSHKGLTAVTRGLAVGEQVVVDGQMRVVPGGKVAVKQGPGAGDQGSGKAEKPTATTPPASPAGSSKP